MVGGIGLYTARPCPLIAALIRALRSRICATALRTWNLTFERYAFPRFFTHDGLKLWKLLRTRVTELKLGPTDWILNGPVPTGFSQLLDPCCLVAAGSMIPS